MIDLQPQRGDDRVAIPVSFDTKWDTQELKVSKLYISFAISIAAFLFWVVILFLAQSNDIRIWSGVLLVLGVPTFLRYAFIGEHRWKKNFRELQQHNYQYDYSLFWNIYDTSTTEPTFYFHTTGNNSLFVAFDKDVIVGKGEDSAFDHFEALSDAYNLLAKKGITCTHIDYMDNVGKDNRLVDMMDELNHTCKSPDLKNCVLDMYEYMQWYMSDTFSDYDVYCFTSKMRIDLMLDELLPVLNAMMGGNYIRYRILDRQEVRALVASVYDIPDFSVTRSCDSLFASRSASSYIKIIWTEKDGKREKVNKTRAEIAEEARIQQAEREARKANRSKKLKNVNIDLFDDTEADKIAAKKKAQQTAAFKQATQGTPQQPRANVNPPQQPFNQARQGTLPQQATPQLPENAQQGTTTDDTFDLID